MDRYLEIFAKRLSDGASHNDALADLRAAGASPIDAIKAVRSVLKVNLAEAKRIFSEAPAWSAEVRAADELHEELISLYEKGEDLG